MVHARAQIMGEEGAGIISQALFLGETRNTCQKQKKKCQTPFHELLTSAHVPYNGGL